MLNLTFAEQVKIVLSRKGMTIKELAEIIEERTGKKMSRQNLTQRLGRDNFQEQDMRMIADILGCPFQLSILADSESVERASYIETVEPTERELSKLARAKERKEKRAAESEKARLEAAMASVPSEIETESHEREMTIGDYLDLHEELERRESAKLPQIPEEVLREVEVAEAAKQEVKANEVIEEVVAEEVTEPVDEVAAETISEEAASPQEDVAAEEVEAEAVAAEVVTAEAITQEPAETVEETPAEIPVEEKEEAPVHVEEPAYTEPVAASQEEVYEGPTAADDIAEVLRELEEMEKEEKKKPEPVHREEKKSSGGWRAMFQRRTRREQEAKEAELRAAQAETERYSSEHDYVEYEDTAAPEPAYEQVPYEEGQGYQPPQYEEEPVAEAQAEVDEDAEDLTRGERNPYTGHEYETNSVRTHPKRIGYVQVYDRRDHAWTDMTEWAFMGYQERMKALLGKDYEPPIYLE